MNRTHWIGLAFVLLLGGLALWLWTPGGGVHVAPPAGANSIGASNPADPEGLPETPPPAGHDSAWRAPLDDAVPGSPAVGPGAGNGGGPMARIQGVVLDEATSEPVPEFAIRLRGRDRWEEVAVTDATGHFVTRAELAAGSYSAFSLDHPDRDEFRLKHRWMHFDGDDTVSFDFTPGAPPVELAFQIGSAYRLDLTLPDELEVLELDAFLQAPGQGWSASTITRVRDGAWPWVRFRTPPPEDADASSWARLRISSRNGIFVGEATVPAISGLEDPPVGLALRATAGLDLQVVQGDGQPPKNYRVRLQDGDAQAYPPKTGGNLNDIAIDHRFRGLPLGRYRLLVDAPGFEAFDEWIDLSSPRIHHRIVRLHAPEDFLELAGVFATRSGRLRRDLGVRVEPSEGGHSRPAATAPVEVDGVMVQGFQLGGLAPGRYRVIPTHTQLFRVTPTELLIAESTTDLRFTLEDEAPGVSVSLRVTDLGTERPVGRAVLYLRYPHEAMRTFQANRGAATLHGLPQGSTFEWTLTSPGYRPLFGTQRDIPIGEGPLEWELPMERGYGGLLRFLDATGRPIIGRRVLGDGDELGTTDREGRLLISTERAPDLLEVEGFRLSDGSRRFPSSRIVTEAPETVIRLVPRG